MTAAIQGVQSVQVALSINDVLSLQVKTLVYCVLKVFICTTSLFLSLLLVPFDSCLYQLSKCMSNTTGRKYWLMFLRPCQSAMCIV